MADLHLVSEGSGTPVEKLQFQLLMRIIGNRN